MPLAVTTIIVAAGVGQHGRRSDGVRRRVSTRRRGSRWTTGSAGITQFHASAEAGLAVPLGGNASGAKSRENIDREY